MSMVQRPGSPMESYVNSINDMAIGLPSFKYHSTKEMQDITGRAPVNDLAPGFSFDADEFKKEHKRSHSQVFDDLSTERYAPAVKAIDAENAAKAPKVRVKKNG
jgi:hypothetical protein